METLKLSIKKSIKSIDETGRSYNFDIKVNGRKLGHGVVGVDLKMDANNRPLLTIECVPDVIDVDLDIETNLKAISS